MNAQEIFDLARQYGAEHPGITFDLAELLRYTRKVQEMEREPAKSAHDKVYSEVDLADAYQKGWNDAMLRCSIEPHGNGMRQKVRGLLVPQDTPIEIKFRSLKEIKFRSLNINATMTCDMMPNQFEGTVNGVPFYYRARHGHYELTIYPTDESGFVVDEGSSADAGWWHEETAWQRLLRSMNRAYKKGGLIQSRGNT